MINYYNQRYDEDLLMTGLLQEDDAVFDALYRKYWSSLIHLASEFVEDRDTCKEIVQELFIALYKRRSQLKINVSLSSYLYVSLRNMIRNHIRRRSIYDKHLRVAKRSYAIPGPNNVDQFISLSELEREISACLNLMPGKCREVYLLYQQNQGTLKSMASLLNRPVDTVEKQLRKAIKLLRSHLSRHIVQS